METVLSTESAIRKIWVVKVPPFLAQKWRGVCDEVAQTEAEVGPKLGTIRTNPNPHPTSPGKAELYLDHESTAALPQEYVMQAVPHDAASGMLAFSESGRRAAAEGSLLKRFDVEPSTKGDNAARLDAAYRNLSKERTEVAAKKARTIQMMTEPRFTNIRRPVGLTDVGGPKRKDASEKRVAKPAADLQADLFRMFERQGHWAFVQLQRETEQPTQHLKMVLLEIALQNKRGPYKDLWELKKEFKTGDASGVAPGNE